MKESKELADMRSSAQISSIIFHTGTAVLGKKKNPSPEKLDGTFRDVFERLEYGTHACGLGCCVSRRC